MEILFLVVGVLAGAIFGVLADLLFRHIFLRFILNIKRIVARFAKHADPLAGKPNQLKFGNVITDWVALHGTGDLPLNSQHLRADLSEEFIYLPPELNAIREEVKREMEEKELNVNSDIWNGQRFSLVKFYPTRYGIHEEFGLNFEFKLTDYAAYIGITRKADQIGLIKDSANNPTTIREKYFPRFDPNIPNPFLTHSFGINLLVITKDHKVLIVQRSPYVAERKMFYSISVNESMQYPQDIDETGKPSFVKTAIRGLWEELGIEFVALDLNIKSIEFLNFGAVAHANEYAILGRIKLPVSALEVEETHHLRGKDAGLEIKAELYAVDYLPDAILEFISMHSPWVDNGLATLYYAMVREWGYWEVKSAFSRNPLKWEIRQEEGFK